MCVYNNHTIFRLIFYIFANKGYEFAYVYKPVSNSPQKLFNWFVRYFSNESEYQSFNGEIKYFSGEIENFSGEFINK